MATQFPLSWGTPPTVPDCVGNAVFSVLYSDVGPTFYANCGPNDTSGTGWIVRGNKQTRWDLHTTPAVPPSSVHLERLSEEQAVELWEDDADVVKAEASALVGSAPKEKVSFAFLPTKGIGQFTITRTMNIDASLAPTLPATKWGIQLVPEGERPGQSANGPFATWTLELRGQPKVLLVTRLRVSQEAFPSLLGQLLDVAQEQGVDVLEIWNLSGELEGLAQSFGGVTATRDDHLPSFKWYGPESSNDVDWLFNEK